MKLSHNSTPAVKKSNSRGIGTNSRLPPPPAGGARGGHLSSYHSTHTFPPLNPPPQAVGETSNVNLGQKTWEVTTFLFVRELKVETEQIQANTSSCVFDNRFICSNNGVTDGNLSAAYLGEAGWANLPEDFRKSVNIKPKRIVYSYPAIFCGDTPIAVPHLAYKAEGYEKNNFIFQLITSPQKRLLLVSAFK